MSLVSPGTRLSAYGVERDEAAVGADRGLVAAVVGLIAGGVDADPLGRPGLAVMDEDVGCAVGVAGDQVVGVGMNATKRPSALIAGSKLSLLP